MIISTIETDVELTLSSGNSPKNEAELLTRAQNLAGMTLGEIAAMISVEVPKDLKREKGWIGLLLEQVLGASAGSRPEPDFPHLGIELKSLPINYQGKPLETTFVCVAPLTGLVGAQWQTSHIRNKLARVLWIPVISERSIAVAERMVGTAFIWSPSPEEEHLLALDWQELTDMIVLGNVENIFMVDMGKYYNCAQKPLIASAKTQAFNRHGQPFMTLPRGFYLKTAFTQALLNKHLRIN